MVAHLFTLWPSLTFIFLCSRHHYYHTLSSLKVFLGSFRFRYFKVLINCSQLCSVVEWINIVSMQRNRVSWLLLHCIIFFCVVTEVWSGEVKPTLACCWFVVRKMQESTQINTWGGKWKYQKKVTDWLSCVYLLPSPILAKTLLLSELLHSWSFLFSVSFPFIMFIFTLIFLSLFLVFSSSSSSVMLPQVTSKFMYLEFLSRKSECQHNSCPLIASLYDTIAMSTDHSS